MFVLLLTAASCLTRRPPSAYRETDFLKITLQADSSCLKEDVPLLYTIENQGNEPVYIDDPSAFNNIQALLYQDDVRITEARKIKAPRDQQKGMVLLQPREKQAVKYQYTLYYLFGSRIPAVKKGSRYNVKLRYWGDVYDADRKPVFENNGVVSNTISF